jgi:FkbM family methyltransferase
MKNKLIAILQKLVAREKTFLKLKDILFTNPAEHLYRATSYINSHKLERFGKSIIDVGAATGGTCRYFAHKFPSHVIYGFEPQQGLYEAAGKLCADMQNVRLFNVALSDDSRESDLHVAADPLSSSLLPPDMIELASIDPLHALKVQSASKVKVRVQRLDDILQDKGPFLLIKIDTQGTELSVLKGARRVLQSSRFVLVEMNIHKLYEGACSYFEVDEYLRGCGFELRDMYVIYRPKGRVGEYDALYENAGL